MGHVVTRVSHQQQSEPEPPVGCTRCPRLAEFLAEQRLRAPDWHNAPVPSFGQADARLLVVGLAPGMKGANRTGRPFTGDYAGDLLYATLLEHGFAAGTYDARPDDGLRLVDCMITNAVRCVPPANKPTGTEIANCRSFLAARIAAQSRLCVMLALGRVAHESILAATGNKRSAFPFGHGRRHDLGGSLVLYDSFHCSRYNTNTGRLTPDMFRSVFSAIRNELDRATP